MIQLTNEQAKMLYEVMDYEKKGFHIDIGDPINGKYRVAVYLSPKNFSDDERIFETYINIDEIQSEKGDIEGSLIIKLSVYKQAERIMNIENILK